jgi:hypothetical protein
MNYVQTIQVRTKNPEAVVELLRQWDRDQAQADIMGYMGTRVLADRDDPDRYLIVADFAMVDPNVSAAEEAMRNNDRPETQEWANRLLEVIEGEPIYHHYDEPYRTG